MVVRVQSDQNLSGALVSIQVSAGKYIPQQEGITFDQWEYVDDSHTKLKLAGTQYCLDASSGNPDS